MARLRAACCASGSDAADCESASRTCAVSSISGYHSLANSKYQPEGSTFGRLMLQSPLLADFLRKQPVGRGRQRAFRHASRFAQNVHRDGRIPHRRKARLEEETAMIVDHQVHELARGFLDDRDDPGIPQEIQRHHHVHHGRVNRAQSVGIARALENPLLGAADGPRAQAARAVPFPQFQEPVRYEEKIAPAQELLAIREGQRDARHEQFLDGESRGHRPPRIHGVQDRERRHDRARPGGHFVDHVARTGSAREESTACARADTGRTG